MLLAAKIWLWVMVIFSPIDLAKNIYESLSNEERDVFYVQAVLYILAFLFKISILIYLLRGL